MPTYSVAEAKNNVSELIDRALNGEGVLITRHGKPVVEFRPVPVPVGPVSDADLHWLAVNRLRPQKAPAQDSGKLVSDLRDEDAILPSPNFPQALHDGRGWARSLMRKRPPYSPPSMPGRSPPRSARA